MTIRVVALLIALCGQTSLLEVATVKPHHEGQRSRYPVLKNGTLTAENIPLKRLLAAAWGVNDICVNGPGWLETETFDITAKAREGTPDSEMKPLLQAILKERLGVVAHIEKKEAPVFDLLVARDGIKLHPFDPAHPPVTPPNTGGSVLIGIGTMTQIANMLTFAARLPVIDKTGIEGRYSYTLSYAPLSAQPEAGASASGPPDVFTAVQDQLGLKLKSAKGMVEFLIVEHADKVPTEN